MYIINEHQTYNEFDSVGFSFADSITPNPYSLSYLGSRDYIDISSIWSAFSQANGNKFDCTSVEEILIRILKPIKNKVFSLRFNARDTLPQSLKSQISAEIFYTLDSIEYRELLIEGNDPIVDRRLEKALNLDEYIAFSKDEAHFIKPLNDEHHYNYMVIGRIFIEQFMFDPPRVASCYVKKLISIEMLPKIVVTLGRKSSKFLQIRYELNNSLLNEVLISRRLKSNESMKSTNEFLA